MTPASGPGLPHHPADPNTAGMTTSPKETPVIVTINAHQLGRLIHKVNSHVGNEFIEVLHGVRLDIDVHHLHAVASDRYTVAAARYRLNRGEQNQEPWARTIPAAWIKPLREWLDAQAGHLPVAISTETGRLVFTAAHTEMRVPVTDGQEFINWRALLRGVAVEIGTIFAFPAVDSRMLARWADTDDTLRVRMTSNDKALMVFGEDFVGAQMPKRYAGIGPCEEETFEQALKLWSDIFADADDIEDMETVMSADMVAEDKPHEAPYTVSDMVESLLKQTLRSTTDLLGAPSEDPGAVASYAIAGVNAWSAYRLLKALHTADPRLAAQTVADLGDQLESGEIGEWAWDAAEKAGHNPQVWHDEYEAHLKKLAAKANAAA